jgi:hypothetical protein
MPRKPAVRKKPTALWPYHHCTMASCTPEKTCTDLEPQIDTGMEMLFTTWSIATVMMKDRKNQLAT